MNYEVIIKKWAGALLLSSFFLLPSYFASAAEVVPAERRITWEGNAGIPGGIPNRTTISATLSTSGGDDRTAINNAIAAAASTHVVKLNAGNYTISGPITMKAGVVLRGAGATTVINGNFSGNMVEFPSPRFGDTNIAFNTGVSAAKGATSVQLISDIPNGVPSTPRLQVGDIVSIGQVNDGEVFAGYSGNSGEHAKSQWVIVTAIDSGTDTITFTPPLYSAFPTAQSPRARFPYAFEVEPNCLKYAGLEDVKLVNAHTSGICIFMSGTAYCWVKGVETVNAGVAHIRSWDGFRCEVRDSYFHGILAPITSSRGYGIQLGEFDTPGRRVSGWLIENNIFRNNRFDIMLGHGLSGSVIGYNYFDDPTFEVSDVLPASISIHSGHTIFNLIEGNAMLKYNPDHEFGSGAYNTAARNWIKGHSTGRTETTTCVQIDAYHRYSNIVGNVLGVSGVTAIFAALTTPNGVSMYSAVQPAAIQYENEYKIFMLGYKGSGGEFGAPDADAQVASTLLAKGNYNFVNNAIPAGEALGGDTVASSYYLPSRPSWWNAALPWPPFDSANALAAGVDDIPAGRRYLGLPEAPEGGGGITVAPNRAIPSMPAGRVL